MSLATHNQLRSTQSLSLHHHVRIPVCECYRVSAESTRTASRDGTPRPACKHMLNCYPWALGECKEALSSGLFIKAYCLDEYCYALCPPVFPSAKSSSPTLLPPEHTDKAKETTVTVTKTLSGAFDPWESIFDPPVVTIWPNGDEVPSPGDDDAEHASTTHPPPPKTTNTKTQTDPVMTWPDRPITLPVEEPPHYTAYAVYEDDNDERY